MQPYEKKNDLALQRAFRQRARALKHLSLPP
jgi:hypothetical protein